MSARKLVLAACVLVGMLLQSRMVGAQALGAACNPEDQLKAYLRNHNIPAKVVLAFDHQTRTWTGYRWDGNSRLDPLVKDVDIKTPFTNKPRLFLSKEEVGNLEVFVVNTNPLVFSTKPTDNTVANIEELANLQKFTGLLGGFLSSAVSGLSPEFRAPQPAADLDIATGQELEMISTFSIDLGEASDNADARRTQEPSKWKDLAVLAEAGEEIGEKLKASAKTLQDALDAMEKPRGELERQTRQLKETASEIRSYVQLVESGGPDRINDHTFSNVPNFTVLIDSSASALAATRNGLEQFMPICPGTLTSLRDAVRLYRVPLPSALADQTPPKDQFRNSLNDLAMLNGCALGLDVPVAKVRDYLGKAKRGPSASGATSEEDEVLRPLFQSLDAYLTLVERRKTALKTVGDLLAESGTAAKVGGAVDDFIRRLNDHRVAGDPCSLQTGVLRVDRNPGLATQLSWTQVGTGGLQVVADSPFKGDAQLRHPDITAANFEIRKAGKWDFDVDVATYYTEIVDPKFSAVKPAGATNPVITLTDEDSRAGELAMFLGLQWRPRKAARSLFSVGPELGIGLSTDHPSIFAGAGFGIGRYIKLGLGWTWQEVKELQRGQTLGVTEVENDAAIKTRTGYEDDYYISLSITIDELPFFKAP